jgi:deferrochelatase/peroxidase EfeB
MNLRPGIDTHDPDFHLIVKVNISFEDRGKLMNCLKAIAGVSARKMDPQRCFGVLHSHEGTAVDQKFAVGDLALNLLVGFGLRFFAGELQSRLAEDPVPNFPPGGTFKPRKARRFGLEKCNIPLYLRTMNASGDREFLGKRQAASLGRPLEPAELDTQYLQWLGRSESDLLLWFEADNLFLVVDFWDAVRKEAVVPFGLEVVSVQHGFQRGDGRDHTGFNDGVDNLQARMLADPQYYRSKVYTPHPAPPYPGEPDWSRDGPEYDAGTYLVHRKYIEHLDRWNSSSFESVDSHGRKYCGAEARAHAIGRDMESGRVICRMSGKLLELEPDGTEVNLAYNEAHILKARGGVTAPFSAPFPPLKGAERNVFNTQDVRIRRRGVNYCEIDPQTGEVVYGLHFVCFQNNIQQTGFEFINNIWLLNPDFRLSKDGLFDPEAGVIEPVEGCYYFVPPEHREFPGEVFFE